LKTLEGVSAVVSRKFAHDKEEKCNLRG
jgi:hypothetical protein